MYAAVSSLKSLIKLGTVVTTNPVFQLSCKLTVLLLLMFSVIVTTNQFFGDPIDCMTSSKDEVPQKVLDNYCWISATFVLPQYINKFGMPTIAPGVGQHIKGQKQTYVSYYQWVGFFLFFDAVLFYFPNYLWKIIEGGKMKNIILGLHNPIIEKDSDKGAKVNTLAKFITGTLGRHRYHAYGYAVCEVLNFVIVVCQIYFTNVFLDYEFTTYGTEVVQFAQMDQGNRSDPMITIFPRVTKCTFRKYGPAGSLQNHDALCVLPVNVINEKVFIFLWFWYIIVAVFCGLALLYRIFLVLNHKARLRVIMYSNHYVDSKLLEHFIIWSDYGDWFLLRSLEKNLHFDNYVNLIEEIYRLMKENTFIITKEENSSYTIPKIVNGYTIPKEENSCIIPKENGCTIPKTAFNYTCPNVQRT